jgi:glycosyltransferase involved in cell wall biosynthesis
VSRISVVIPCYNAEAYLAEAIASVRAQSRSVEEIIVVDDGSTDGSAALAASLGVILIRSPANGGESAARNLGIAASRGDLIAFLDADDWWEPRHLEIVAGLLDEFPAADVAFSRERFEGGPEHGFVYPPDVVPPRRVQRLLMRLFEGNPIPHSSAVVRREALARVGGYDTAVRYTADYDLWLRLALSTEFVASDAVSVTYRVHGGQMSRARAEMIASGWQTSYRSWSALVAQGRGDEAREAAEVLRRKWRRRIEHAWSKRDWHLLTLLYDQAPLVPGSDRDMARHAWRARVARAIHGIERVLRRATPSWVRRAVARRPAVPAAGR